MGSCSLAEHSNERPGPQPSADAPHQRGGEASFLTLSSEPHLRQGALLNPRSAPLLRAFLSVRLPVGQPPAPRPPWDRGARPCSWGAGVRWGEIDTRGATSEGVRWRMPGRGGCCGPVGWGRVRPRVGAGSGVQAPAGTPGGGGEKAGHLAVALGTSWRVARGVRETGVTAELGLRARAGGRTVAVSRMETCRQGQV